MDRAEEPDPEGEDWDLANPLSVEVFKLMKAIYGEEPWQHLPFAGGWLDQPDWWQHDYPILEWRYKLNKEALGNAQPGGKARVGYSTA